MNITRNRPPIGNSFYAKVPLINPTLITKTYTMLPDEIKTQHNSRMYIKKTTFYDKKVKEEILKPNVKCKDFNDGVNMRGYLIY